MWKFGVIVIALYVLYRMFSNDGKRKRNEPREKEESARKTDDMARDPICGTYVAKEEALKVRDKDTVYYFCGYECRDKFLERLEGQPEAHAAMLKDAADASAPEDGHP